MSVEVKQMFTPGPWKYCPGSEKYFPHVHIGPVKRYRGGHCREYLTINEAPDETSEHATFEANARLIASAPDLLQALQLIMRDLPTRRDWLDPVTEQMARAALLKAEGK